MTRRTLTLPQQVAIADALRARSAIVDGAVEFAEGWDDQKIADLCGVEVDQVASVRRRLLGNIHRKREATAEDLARTSAALQKSVDGLSQALAALSARVAALEVRMTAGAVAYRPDRLAIAGDVLGSGEPVVIGGGDGVHP